MSFSLKCHSSGMDSSSTLEIVSLIKNLCSQRNVAAIMVIHQPNLDVFNLFDKLTIVSNGHVVFSDFTSSLEDLYSNKFLKQFPSQEDLPTKLLIDSQQFIRPLKHIEDGLEKNKSSGHGNHTNQSHFDQESDESSSTSILWKFYIVFERNLQIRNLKNLCFRIGITAFLSLILGLVCWQVGAPLSDNGIVSPNEAHDIKGAVLVLFLICFFLPITMTGPFSEDKKFFHADSNRGLYPLWMYCISFALLEACVLVIQAFIQAAITIPMIGLRNESVPTFTFFETTVSIFFGANLVGNSLVMLTSACLNQESAQLSAVGILFIWFVFSGGIVKIPSLAGFVSWVPLASPMKYTNQAFVLLNFWNTKSEQVYIELEQYDQTKEIMTNVDAMYSIFLILSCITVLASSRQCK